MADIRTFLEKIKTAVYGRDVRQAIHDGIRCCYEDGKAGATDLTAREDISKLQEDTGRGLVKASYSCQDLADVTQAIITEIANMTIDSVKTVGVKLNTDFHQCAAKLTIYLGLNPDGQYVSNAELATTDGHRLYTYGHVAAGALLNEMVFSEWEWENPPMNSVGTEYCTTERYMGSPVYIRNVQFYSSDLPSALKTTVSKSVEVSAMPIVVSASGMLCLTTYGSDDMVASRDFYQDPGMYADEGITGNLFCISTHSYRNASANKFNLEVAFGALSDYALSSMGGEVTVTVKYIKT